MALQQLRNIPNPEGNASSKFGPSWEMGLQAVRFVHGPGYQQLQVWLPDYGRLYPRFELLNTDTGETIWSEMVANYLQGSVQPLFDHSPWLHAAYLLRFFKQDGCIHEIVLVKGKEEQKVARAVQGPSTPITYRDGAGKVLPDQDLELRKEALDKMAQAFRPKIRYVAEGRGGYVIYQEAGLQLQLWWEFGTGNCVAFIDVPPPKSWEAYTPFSLQDRDRILQEIAETVSRDQFSHVRFTIRETEIAFCRK